MTSLDEWQKQKNVVLRKENFILQEKEIENSEQLKNKAIIIKLIVTSE